MVRKTSFVNVLKSFIFYIVKSPTYEVKPDDWLLVNINCTGYYRVNYEEGNWKKLIKQLETSHHVSIGEPVLVYL